MSKGYQGFYNKHAKRWIGFVLALVLMIMLLPFYLIIGAVVAIESGFPVFYCPQTGGYKNKPFRQARPRKKQPAWPSVPPSSAWPPGVPAAPA